MRVVVTRPESSGSKTAALLRERGHEPVLLPLTKPVHDIGAVVDALASPPGLLAITSAETIRALEAGETDISALRDVPLFAVGSATAKAARSFGFENIHTGEGDGRALADLIATTVDVADLMGRSVVYLAGRPREAAFEDALQQAGIDVQTVEVYAMHPIEWPRTDILSRMMPEPDAVLLYSRETARAFFALMLEKNLSSALDNAKFICISEKVLSTVPEVFRGRAFASPQPRETAMFDLADRIAGT